MNRTLFSLALIFVSLSASAGVKVTSMNLKTEGPNGYVSINLEGNLREVPDIKVHGNTIEVTLSGAEAFSAISKNVSGAQLSANVLNGNAIVKAILPYELPVDGVDLGWKNKNIEVIFPRGKVKKEFSAVNVDKKTVVKKTENKVLEKIENAVVKESLDENYLNNLMNEDTKKPVAAAPTQIKKDEIKVQQASIAKNKESTVSTDNFSFAGYAVKFIVFLAMVLGLFYGVVQLLKKGVFNRGKLGFLNNSQLIQVLSTTYVAPKRSLMVVKAHNQIFLVANSENGLQFLSEMTDTTGLIKEGEKLITGTNFDLNLVTAETSTIETNIKIKENINESTEVSDRKGISGLTAKDIVKFSDELKKKAKKLKPIEFN